MRLKMFFRARRLAMAVAVAAATFSFAAELPVKKVNGHECFYYVAKKGDTSMSVAKNLGISYSELLKFNRAAADGIKAGQTLFFPVKDFDGRIAQSADGVQHATEAAVSGDVATNPVHTVEKHETLFGIGKLYGLSPDELVKLNPWASTGISAGQRLSLPAGTKVRKENTDEGSMAASEMSKVDNVSGSNKKSHSEVAEDIKVSEVEKDGDKKAMTAHRVDELPVASQLPAVNNRDANGAVITLMLPFMLGQEKISRQASLVTDYYRGFVIAVDTMQSISAPMSVRAIDSGDDLASLKRMLETDVKLGSTSVIIGPSDPLQFETVAEFGRKNGIYVFNSYIVKDSTYLTNPYIVQTFIDQTTMYDKAADYAVSLVLDNDKPLVPVILNNTSGKKDKQAIVDMIISRFNDAGVVFKTVSYDGTLTQLELQDALLPSENYLFIPLSGTVAEFNKISVALTKFIESDMAVAGGSAVTFGYPEWMAFRAKPLADLPKIGARIYSRFYSDESSTAYTSLANSFKHWYGVDMQSGVPVQGVLGFDAAEFLIKSFNSTGTDLSQAVPFEGIQSAFSFQRVPGGGLVNTALYIIEYLPGGAVNVTVR